VSQESNYSFTVKTPRGNLFTVRGDSAAETAANLDAAASSGLLGKIAGIEASLAGQAAPQAPAATAAPAVSSASASQELPAAYGVKCGTCGADTKFEQEGISKNSGLPYKRYSCTANQLHKATFTN